MKTLVLGIDGYIGWPLAVSLLQEGHEVMGIDNLLRRQNVAAAGSKSLTPIPSSERRNELLTSKFGDRYYGTMLNTIGGALTLKPMIKDYKPDVIFHLAQQPSASWSMCDEWNCAITQTLNITSTLSILWYMKNFNPDAHLIKIGTMGEYGQPDCVIPEGFIPEICISEHKSYGGQFEADPHECVLAGLPFPRQAGSFYHLSKVHNTHNIIFACKNWGLKVTDIMQGVVCGLNIEAPEHKQFITRLDYDQYFGTVIHRFCAQALSEHPLTIYGAGGQTRGYISLKDSIACLKLVMENPPAENQNYRVLNQFAECWSVLELAELIIDLFAVRGIKTTKKHLDNIRNEKEFHYYDPVCNKLEELGYTPTPITAEVIKLIDIISDCKLEINKDVFMPTTRWR